jgi:Xaa-Pro aminopeptidase
MATAAQRKDAPLAIPFDSDRLDALMDQAGIDLLLSTSKHNVQYLLGGHRAMFFGAMDAMGLSRYLPVFAYPKGAPEAASYVGHRLEGYQRAVAPFWTTQSATSSSGSVDAIENAAEMVRKSGAKTKRIGVETAFLPADSAEALQKAFPDAELVDALPVLERLRAIKSPQELKMLREASERVTDAMLAVFAQHGVGSTKREIIETLRREEVNRGLDFDYCLLAMGSDRNRAASDQKWQRGDVLSIDSGGNYHGYIGDLARMAIVGDPDAELEDLLADIDRIQQAAFKAVKAGAMGGEIYVAGERALAESKEREHLEFLAHGMGLVSHEAPHLTAEGPVPYHDEDARRPLEAGMVVSIETTLHHPKRGFIKLEDTVAVTPTGYEVYGDRARGWNRAGR